MERKDMAAKAFKVAVNQAPELAGK